MKLRGVVAGGCWGWISKKVNLGSWIDVSAEEGDESKAAGDEGVEVSTAVLPSKGKLVGKRVEIFREGDWFPGTVTKYYTYHSKKDDKFHCHKVVYDDITEEHEILNLDGSGAGIEQRKFRMEVQGEKEEQPAPALPAPPVLPVPPRRRRKYRLRAAQEAGSTSEAAEVGAADLFSTTYSLVYNREAGKRQTYKDYYRRTCTSPSQARNLLLKYLSIILGGRSRKPQGALSPDSDPESYPRCSCPACSYSVRDSNGNWSDVHIRHAGFVRCYLDSDSDKVFIATFVRPWSKTLRLAEEKRREEIDDLVNTALEGATASGMDMAV